MESVISALLIVFVLRTQQPFWRSRPSRPLVIVTFIVAIFTLLLPYTPLAAPLGFVPLSLNTLFILMVIILLYFMISEMVKQWFYRRLVNA